MWYLYFDIVVGLAWSYEPESYAGGSVAAGRVSYLNILHPVVCYCQWYNKGRQHNKRY
jgi:hypothetical protein